MATVGELFPELCRELQELLGVAGRADLVERIPHLPVVSRCTCGDSSCAHFYTAEPPSGPYGPGHSNLPLPARTGLVVLDLLHDTIVAVEVLDRPDVKAKLDAAMPLPRPNRRAKRRGRTQ